jgi:hypothetical protein
MAEKKENFAVKSEIQNNLHLGMVHNTVQSGDLDFFMVGQLLTMRIVCREKYQFMIGRVNVGLKSMITDSVCLIKSLCVGPVVRGIL